MRILKERTRGSNTLTEAGYWAFIRSGLRSKSMYWPPIHKAKLKARRASKSANKRLKYEYQCAICKQWWPDKDIEVDHITPVGTLRSGDDLKLFVENLFCEEDKLRILCENCHKQVTKEQKQN